MDGDEMTRWRAWMGHTRESDEEAISSAIAGGEKAVMRALRNWLSLAKTYRLDRLGLGITADCACAATWCETMAMRLSAAAKHAPKKPEKRYQRRREDYE